MNFEQIVNLISQSQKPYSLIGIDGRPGSGKTTLALKLEHDLNVQTIYLDEFFIPQSQWPHNHTPRFPFFYFRYQKFIDGIKTLASGKSFSYQAYDPQTNAPSSIINAVEPKGIIIIEGVSVLHSDLVSLYDHTIWVESDRASELAAIKARENGTNLDLWETIYLPSVEIYCLQKPWERADIIYNSRGTN